jgi:GGDEF domain-containing protein
LALIRVNGFEQFTQHYGVVVGEDVLKFTALLLCDVVRQQSDTSDCVGQLVVGPYFLIVSPPGRIEVIADALIARFDADIRLHYGYRDIQLGHAPMMALSVAVVTSDDGPFADIRQLTETAEALLPHSVGAAQGPRRSKVIRREGQS